MMGADVAPTNVAWLLPALVLLMGGIGLGMGMIISSLTTKYRDLKFLLTFAVQLFMYATPIIYPVSALPEKYKIYILVNPITPIIETFRFGFLGKGNFDPMHLLYSFAFMIVVLFVATIIFNQVEKNFMDTV